MDEPKVLGDRYEVGDMLGYGGMAEVRYARDTRLDRDVAIKILRSDLARDQTFRARFRREAQSAAALNHPSIVAVYDTGADPMTEPPTPYIVMEYVEGQTLRDLLRSEKTLQPHQAMQITAEMCAALDFSHRNGIVHRDVKPGNVMITPAGRVKVMDFGIARAVSDTAATMTATAAVIGTAQYLSPEQARGESVDARSDVYAAGCVLYELLTGAPPFVGDSPVAVAYQHVREIPKPPSTINPIVSRELDAIVLKALSKNPANRYQSAAAMQEDLDRALAGKKVEATPLLTEEEATRVLPAGGGTPSLPSAVDYLDNHPPERSGLRGGMWAALIVLVLGAVVAAFFLLPKLTEDKPATVAVPSVHGMTQEEATAKLEGAGLKVGEVTTGVSSVEQMNKVIGQEPSSNSNVEKGTAINLEIGAGPAQKMIPEIVGKQQAEAEQLLTANGLVPTVLSRDDPAPAGTVVDSSPPVGTSVPEGSPVTVFVSSGLITLPNVKNKNITVATEELKAAGFLNVSTVEVEDSTHSPGTVLEQDPAPGKAAPGGTVTLTVAKAPPAPPPPTTSEPPPTTSSAPPPTTSSPPPTTSPASPTA